MSTRSNISLELPDGKYKTIYCHFDGYPEHNGEILLKYYNTREKVEKLLSHGNLSSLAPEIDPDPSLPHSFDYDERQEDVCVFYGRDRGDTEQDAKILTLENLKDADWIEYFYIFTLDNKWKFYAYDFDKLYDLQKELENIESNNLVENTSVENGKKHNSHSEM